jgi:histidinol-phosphatase (PHP family)
LERLSTLLQQNTGRVDYLVGSIHHVNGLPIDFDLETFKRCMDSVSVPPMADGSLGNDSGHRRMATFLDVYFDAQFELLQRFQPEVVGHIDLFRLYTPILRLRNFPHAWEKLERNIKYAINYGALFEASAAAFRKGWNTAYPGEDVAEVSL